MTYWLRMGVGWVRPEWVFKGEFSKVIGNWVTGSMLVGGGCSPLISCLGSIPKEHVKLRDCHTMLSLRAIVLWCMGICLRPTSKSAAFG